MRSQSELVQFSPLVAQSPFFLSLFVITFFLIRVRLHWLPINPTSITCKLDIHLLGKASTTPCLAPYKATGKYFVRLLSLSSFVSTAIHKTSSYVCLTVDRTLFPRVCRVLNFTVFASILSTHAHIARTSEHFTGTRYPQRQENVTNAEVSSTALML